MDIELIYGIIKIVLIATTPLVFAGIGELVTEKSGVLNLGVEGMMLVGAVTAFVTLVITNSYILAFAFSILSGILMSGLFAFLVLVLININYIEKKCQKEKNMIILMHLIEKICICCVERARTMQYAKTMDFPSSCSSKDTKL